MGRRVVARLGRRAGRHERRVAPENMDQIRIHRGFGQRGGLVRVLEGLRDGEEHVGDIEGVRTDERVERAGESGEERAAKSLHDVAAIDEKLSAHVQRLVLAINGARERQQAQAHEVEARAQAPQARAALFHD